MRTYKTQKYRNIQIRGYKKESISIGWTIDIPGDNNIYASHYCAMNAIDMALGTSRRKGCNGGTKRRAAGIKIIGKVEEELK